MIINGFKKVFSSETEIISKQIKLLFEKFFFMCMTLAFYYFADFNYENRQKKLEGITFVD